MLSRCLSVDSVVVSWLVIYCYCCVEMVCCAMCFLHCFLSFFLSFSPNVETVLLLLLFGAWLVIYCYCCVETLCCAMCFALAFAVAGVSTRLPDNTAPSQCLNKQTNKQANKHGTSNRQTNMLAEWWNEMIHFFVSDIFIQYTYPASWPVNGCHHLSISTYYRSTRFVPCECFTYRSKHVNSWMLEALWPAAV